MKFDDDEMKWKVLSTENLISRPWLNVDRDRVQLPDTGWA